MFTLVQRLPTLSRQCESISSFANLDAHEDIEITDRIRTLTEAWAREAVTRILAEDQPLGSDDGPSLVDIALERFDFTWFKEM